MAGLLDYLFDPSSYGGDSGLLGRLQQSLASVPSASSGGFPDQGASFADRFNALPNAPQPVMGSSRSFDAASFNPATFAPNQAQPIAVGNYQMPRIGDAGQFQPSPAIQAAAAAPPSALNANAQQPGPQPQEEASLPPAFGGDYLSRVQAGGGLIRSLFGATPGQQNLKAQYDAFRSALIANGENPQTAASKAMVAAMNPEAAKTILPELFTNKEKFAKIGTDALGRDRYGFVNELAQTVNGQAINAQGGQQPYDIGNGLPGDTTKTGDAYIASLPKEYQGIVRGFVEGTAKMPNITTKNQQAMQTYFDMAKQADPSFDATNYGARQKGMNSFKAGTDASVVRSANQVLGHISDLTDKANELGNRSFTPYNAATNTISSIFGNDAANNWITQAHAVADEMSTFMKGTGHSSDTEIKQWLDSLSPNMSPQQQRGAIKTLMGIYDHALQALEDKRTGAVGSMAADKMGPLLTQSGKASMDKINTWANGGGDNTPASAPNKVAIEAEMRKRGLLK